MKNLYIFDNQGVKDISVIREPDIADLQYLLHIFDHQKDCVQITFLHVNMISHVLIDRLFDIHDKKNSKIYVLEKFLYLYLYQLGLNCSFIEKKYLADEEARKKIQEKALEITLEEDQVRTFLGNIAIKYKYDYTKYQVDSIYRRIKMTMEQEKIYDFERFADETLKCQVLFERLLLEFSINTTEFFRDPEVYGMLKSKVLPILNQYGHIKIWSCGCSSGEEPYSLAILLDEWGMLKKSQIYATDINPYILGAAKNGLFPINNLEKMILDYRKALGSRSLLEYFEFKGSYLKIERRIREHILFFQSNLEKGINLSEFHLILCRNVLIYFDTELQSRVLNTFYDSLEPHGFLVLGKYESMVQNKERQFFDKYCEKSKIFQKRAMK